MSTQGNFIVTIIAFALIAITAVLYVFVNVYPNIYWLVGLIVLVALAVTLIFSVILFAFGKLRSFETPRDMYRRQLKKAVIVGLITIILLLVQKFFDIF